MKEEGSCGTSAESKTIAKQAHLSSWSFFIPTMVGMVDTSKGKWQFPKAFLCPWSKTSPSNTVALQYRRNLAFYFNSSTATHYESPMTHCL